MKRTARAGAAGDGPTGPTATGSRHCASRTPCTSGDISLVLYDVTTLYFEAENEDDLRKVGYSKERRVDPQIVVGLLVDRGRVPAGDRLLRGQQGRDRHHRPDRQGVPGPPQTWPTWSWSPTPGCSRRSNLTELDEANLRFIVGSRMTKAPIDLAVALPLARRRVHRRAADRHHHAQNRPTRNENNPDAARRTGLGPRQHPGSWRAVWAYSRQASRP